MGCVVTSQNMEERSALSPAPSAGVETLGPSSKVSATSRLPLPPQ